jgi:hypothetical protein
VVAATGPLSGRCNNLESGDSSPLQIPDNPLLETTAATANATVQFPAKNHSKTEHKRHYRTLAAAISRYALASGSVLNAGRH